MSFLDEGDIKHLIHFTENTELYLPVMIALYTGMRRGEIAAIKWSEVDLDKQIVLVKHSVTKSPDGLKLKTTKSGKSRNIAISQSLVSALRKQQVKLKEQQLKFGGKYKEDLVYPTLNGSITNPDKISSAFKRLTKKHNLPYTFHSLRHTHVALMIKQGESPKFIADRLGHSTINITMDLYGHLFKDCQGIAKL